MDDEEENFGSERDFGESRTERTFEQALSNESAPYPPTLDTLVGSNESMNQSINYWRSRQSSCLKPKGTRKIDMIYKRDEGTHSPYYLMHVFSDGIWA